ncbi:hypothetical protein LR48_Vigan01g262900 [Vigna angularis]|uniref:Uncharacterized protein n=1 Tax=Phaseolus angularis TaxID=3914 RepID=A0A0L9TR67_PHAAN|nr:hypothetical protein LR48_Vigan01g262900 [Vigna angularis]
MISVAYLPVTCSHSSHWCNVLLNESEWNTYEDTSMLKSDMSYGTSVLKQIALQSRGKKGGKVATPGASSAVSHREITTILSGESAFLYGNVVTKNPENPSSSSPSVSGYD